MSETQTQPMLPSQLESLPAGEISSTLPMELRSCGGLLGTPGPLTGRLVADRYLVLETLGEDERCARYRVRHVRMQKELVLEVLRVTEVDQKVVDGFERRLRRASGLDHPAVPPVNDAGRLPDGSPYIILERPAGETLRDCLEREERLTVERAVDITLQICRALAHLHARDLVQGTLSADQVVLRPGHRHRDEARLLRLGEPEGISNTNQAGPRDDVLAVGALLYEMITGQAPMSLDAPAGRWGRRRPIPAMRSRVAGAEVPAGLDRVVQRALQPHPADRYATITRLLDALEQLDLVPAPRGAFVRGMAIALPGGITPGPRSLRPRRKRRHGRALALGTVVGALVATVISLLGYAANHQHQAAAAALSTGVATSAHASQKQLLRLRALVERGRVREAVAAAGRLADRHPADARVHLLVGHLNRLQRHPGEALHHYRSAVRLDPTLRRDAELLEAIGQLLTWSSGSEADARNRRKAMLFVHRYLDARAAPLITRYVNTWWEANQVWRGILFLLRFGQDQQVDYLYAYELLLRTERSCYRRRAYLKDIVARQDPRFLGLLQRVADTPGWRAPHTGHWIRNTCIQPEARAALASLRVLPGPAVATTDE